MPLILDGTTGIVANNIAANTITSAQIASGSRIAFGNMPAGSVLQVAQAFKTNVFSLTSQSFIDVTGLTVSITPTASSSKILLMMNVAFSARTTQDSLYAAFGKNSSVITATIGDADSSRPRATLASFPGDASGVNNYQAQATQMYLDSPGTTSPITYSVMMRTANGNTMYVNKTYSDRDSTNYDGRWTSSIIVMEVAA